MTDFEKLVGESIEPMLLSLGFVKTSHSFDGDFGECVDYRLEELEIRTHVRRGEIMVRIRDANSDAEHQLGDSWFILINLLDVLGLERIGSIALESGELRGAPPVDSQELKRQGELLRQHFPSIRNALSKDKIVETIRMIQEDGRRAGETYLRWVKRGSRGRPPV